MKKSCFLFVLLLHAGISKCQSIYGVITDKSSETAGDQSGYFNIKTWIEWEDNNIGDRAFKHIAFEVDQAVLTK